MGAGESLAFLKVALHVAPLRTEVISLGTSGRTWGPWPHTPEDHLTHGLRQQPLLSLALLHKNTHFMFKWGDEVQPSDPCPSTGMPLPSLTQRGHSSLITSKTPDSLAQCPEPPLFYKILHPPPSHPQLTWQVQVMQALLGSRQLSPSATLRPSASTTHSGEKKWGWGSTVCPAASLLPRAHPKGPW